MLEARKVRRDISEFIYRSVTRPMQREGGYQLAKFTYVGHNLGSGDVSRIARRSCISTARRPYY